MGASEEQLAILAANHITHVSYVLTLYSVAFLLFIFVAMQLHIYASSARPIDESNSRTIGFKDEVAVSGGMNGHAGNRIRDAEEFELEGLMSDDDDHIDVGVTGR